VFERITASLLYTATCVTADPPYAAEGYFSVTAFLREWLA
jgi:hypothetical protein